MKTQAIRLHARDHTLLSELGDVGVLDTPTIQRRHFPADATGEACRRRLRLYARNGLIVSCPHPLSFGTIRGGRPSAIHRLTPFGAETVCAHTETVPLRVARGEPLKPDTMRHRLGVAAVHLAVLDACKEHGLPKPQWILEQDTNPQASPEAPFTERFVLYELFASTNGSPRRTSWRRATSISYASRPAGSDS